MDLKVKTRNDKETKVHPPHRQDQMIQAIHPWQVAEHLESIKISKHICLYDEPNLYNDFITKEPDYMDHFRINFPRHCVLGHVLSDSDPLNNLGPWKEVVQPTKKPRSVGPHKSKPKKTTSNNKTRQKNKKSRSVAIQIPEKPRSVKIQVPEPEESRRGDDASTPQRLASVAGHPKNRLYIDSGTSIHILFNKELLGGITNLDRTLKIHAGGTPIHLSQIGSLHQALQHRPHPVSTYHYSENAIANLLSFAKLANDVITSSITQGLTTQYMCKARMMVNTYDFKETISLTYTTWTLARLMVMSIVTSIL